MTGQRDRLLEYGFPSTRLLASLRCWPKGQAILRVWMSRAELRRQIGELSRSYNHEEAGADSAAALNLCDNLACADLTGDGDLNILG